MRVCGALLVLAACEFPRPADVPSDGDVGSGPHITSVQPAKNSTGNPINTTVSVTFDRRVTNIDQGTFRILDGTLVIPSDVTYDSGTETATLTPNDFLTPMSSYNMAVSQAVRDEDGNTLDDEGTWTLGIGADTLPPHVLSVTPADNSTGIGRTAQIMVMFDEPVMSVTTTSFRIMPAMTGTLSSGNSGRLWVFLPSGSYNAVTTYTVTLTTTIVDLYGHTLPSAVTTEFTTGA